jgi:hypothetical protein
MSLQISNVSIDFTTPSYGTIQFTIDSSPANVWFTLVMTDPNNTEFTYMTATPVIISPPNNIAISTDQIPNQGVNYIFNAINTPTNVTVPFFKDSTPTPPNPSNFGITGLFTLSIYTYTVDQFTRDLAPVGSSQGFFCLFEDSEVLTVSGYKSVKELKKGDYVITSSGKKSQIISVLSSIYPNKSPYYPMIIPKNSIALNYPPKDCRLSKGHLIKYNNDWITPYKNEHIFSYDKNNEYIKYYHLQLEDYYNDHLVINGGLVVESKGNGTKDNSNEYQRRNKNSIILKQFNLNNSC